MHWRLGADLPASERAGCRASAPHRDSDPGPAHRRLFGSGGCQSRLARLARRAPIRSAKQRRALDAPAAGNRLASNRASWVSRMRRHPYMARAAPRCSSPHHSPALVSPVVGHQSRHARAPSRRVYTCARAARSPCSVKSSSHVQPHPVRPALALIFPATACHVRPCVLPPPPPPNSCAIWDAGAPEEARENAKPEPR